MESSIIFVPATLCKNLPGYYNISCLDKPGRAGFFPLEGFRMVSLPPFRASLFLKKATHHAHRNQSAQHAANPTHTFRTPFAHPCQDGQATGKARIQAFSGLGEAFSGFVAPLFGGFSTHKIY